MKLKIFHLQLCGNLDQLKDNLKDYDDFFVAIGE